MTFAEVVKSPGVNLKRQLSDSSVFRSPLANRENIIHTTDNGLPKKRMLSEKNRFVEMFISHVPTLSVCLSL